MNRVTIQLAFSLAPQKSFSSLIMVKFGVSWSIIRIKHQALYTCNQCRFANMNTSINLCWKKWTPLGMNDWRCRFSFMAFRSLPYRFLDVPVSWEGTVITFLHGLRNGVWRGFPVGARSRPSSWQPEIYW